MNREAVFATVVVATLFVTGCDRFGTKHEIVRAGNQTYLLNNATGETHVIDGTSLVTVSVPSTTGNNLALQAKNWQEQAIPQLGDIKLAIRTKYRDGSMLYSIEAKPFQGRLEREYTPAPGSTDHLREPTIFVDFYDTDGFQIGPGIELKIRSTTRIVNEKGEVHSLSWTGAQPMALDTYRTAAYQSVRWAGFKKEGPEPAAK